MKRVRQVQRAKQKIIANVVDIITNAFTIHFMQHAEHLRHAEPTPPAEPAAGEWLPLAEAARLFPARNGQHPTVATLKRRIKVGCRGVKLGGRLSGACWYTTREAIERFEAELTRRELGSAAAGEVASGSAARRASSKAARDYLSKLGIGRDQENKTKQRRQAGGLPDARLPKGI